MRDCDTCYRFAGREMRALQGGFIRTKMRGTGEGLTIYLAATRNNSLRALLSKNEKLDSTFSPLFLFLFYLARLQLEQSLNSSPLRSMGTSIWKQFFNLANVCDVQILVQPKIRFGNSWRLNLRNKLVLLNSNKILCLDWIVSSGPSLVFQPTCGCCGAECTGKTAEQSRSTTPLYLASL